MRHMAIIADDLTGASDSGVQFARKGLKTQVLFDLQHFERDTASFDTVVLDTDSRSLPASQAYQQVSETVRLVKKAGFAHLYKKLDSTLRGNLGAEIDAVLDEMPFDLAVIAPAFPKIGRTTVGGRHSLNGVPVHETEIARDPKCPVTESDICTLLAGQSKRKAASVPLQTLRKGAQAVLNFMEAGRADGVELFVFDAETDEDLERIASSMANTAYRPLWVGSAGLADVLPQTLGIPTRALQHPLAEPSEQPTLLVAGSISRITREQVSAYLSPDTVAGIELDPLPVVAGGDELAQEQARCLALLHEALAHGKDAALYAGAAPHQVEAAKRRGAERGLTNTAVSNAIADAIGTIAAHTVEAHPLQGLVLTGGDTAKAVCRHLGVTGLELMRELEPGVPLSRLVGSRNLLTVTKAGAFGTPDTLTHAREVLKGEFHHE